MSLCFVYKAQETIDNKIEGGAKVYEITIKQTFQKAFPAGQEYQRIKGDAKDGWEEGSDEYGYVSKPAYSKEVTETIYTQTIGNMRLIDVIAAFNGCEVAETETDEKPEETKP